MSKSLYQRLCDNAPLILMCMLIGVMHMLYQGYKFGIGNHAIQIPLLKSYFHPDLYPNDPMVATRSHFITFYFIFLAAAERLFGHLEFIFFTAQLITEILTFMAIYHLAHAVFKDRNTAIIAVFLMFTVKPILGGAIIHWNQHTHTYAVLPLILWSLTLFLNRRTRWAYALLGFAANVNIQSATYVLPMFALVSLLRTCRESTVIGWRHAIVSLLKDYGFFVLFSLPCLIWALTKAGGPLTDAWIQQLRARSSHHSFPFSWDVKDYTNYLLFFTLGVMAWALALKESEDREMHWTLGWFSFVVLLLCGIGVVFAEWIPVKIVLRAQLFRSAKFLSIFIVLYTSCAIRYLWGKSTGYKVLAISIFLVLFLPKYLAFLVLIVLLYQLVEAKNLYWWTAPIVAAVLVLRVFIPHAEFPKAINLSEITVFARPFFENSLRLVILAVFLFWMSIRKAKSVRLLSRSSMIVAFLVVFVYILPATYHQMVPPVEQRGNWVRAQIWAKENTPQDAIFLTSPARQGFRIYSERSVVAENKDGTQQYFDTDYSYEWWARVKDIGRNSKQYDNLSAQRLTELCRKYGASYLVFPAAKPLPFTHVYENNDYRVYRMDS
ncbi:DUF6798 domain-containing protein [Candidatus Poribacteria bacterium]